MPEFYACVRQVENGYTVDVGNLIVNNDTLRFIAGTFDGVLDILKNYQTQYGVKEFNADIEALKNES
jgi:hypothetical protein